VTQYKGKCIYSVKNDQHSIEVFENFRYRWLSFGSHYIQSIILKRKPHKPILKYIPHYCFFVTPDDNNALLLGLGGGAVLHYLSHQFSGLNMHAVDYDAQVIAISRQFFMQDSIANLSVENAEAFEFISRSTIFYDRIFIDLYNDYDFPLHCSSVDFFIQCKKRLSANGTLALNIVNFKKQYQLLSHLKEAFNNQVVSMVVPKSGNIIAHASIGKPMLERLKELLAAKKIKSITWNQTLGLTTN